MKKMTSFLVFWLFLLLPGEANDTSISMVGGNIRMKAEPDISLRAEHLIFNYVSAESRKVANARYCPPGGEYADDGNCYIPERWQADLSYELANEGAEKKLQVGLPFLLPACQGEQGFQGPGDCKPIENLQTRIDGQWVAMKQIKQDVFLQQELLFNRIYLFPLSFLPNQTRHLRHRYTTYGINSVAGKAFHYILRSGSNWKGPIEQLKIEFELPSNNGPCAVANLPYRREGNHLKVNLSQWKPDRDFRVTYADRQLVLYGTGLWPFEDTAKAVCQDAIKEPLETRKKLAAQVELLYGAQPTTEQHREALAEGVGAMCQNAVYFSMIANDPDVQPHVGLSGLRYLPDPAYPDNMPKPLRGCLGMLRGGGDSF